MMAGPAMKAALLGFLLPACVASRAAEESQAPEPWSFSATAFAYLVPDDEDYGSGVVTADRGRIHIEGRYNYEDLDTGSVFAGWNLEFGEELTLALTPMVGGVFGETSGVAPAYELTLGYRKLELYSEGEYVFAESSADSFLYTWSELAYSPWD